MAAGRSAAVAWRVVGCPSRLVAVGLALAVVPGRRRWAGLARWAGQSSLLPSVEGQANWFAAAFLMPAAEIRPQLPQIVSWTEYVRLKLRWGVSIAALLRRARSLRLLSHDDYQRAMKALSARGWRRQEPRRP